jgi:hypothetical protein
MLFGGVGLGVLFTAGLANILFRGLVRGVSPFLFGAGGTGLDTLDVIRMLAILTTAWVVTLANVLLVAVDRLSLPTEDSVTPIRLGLLTQLIVMIGWALTFFFVSTDAFRAAGNVLGVLGGVHLTLLAMFAVTESPSVPRRARLRMQSTSPWRWLVRVFGPGGGRGPGNVILQWGILLGALMLFPIDGFQRRTYMAAYGYVCFFVAVPTLVFRVVLPKYATSVRLRVASLLTLAAATSLPDLLDYLIQQPEVLDFGYSGRHLMSPFQTLTHWQIVERNGWAAFPFSVGVIGLVALILLVLTDMRRAEDEESINPNRPAPAAGESGRADLTY